MKSHLTPSTKWVIGFFVFCALTLFTSLAALFFFVSDDFVIHGQIVPGSDPMFLPWKISFSLGVVISILMACVCFTRSRRNTGSQTL